MQVLFVHGMGRSPLSAWPLLLQLRRAGLQTHTFAYSVRRESFEHIRAQLASRIATLAARGDYVLIGHSLGGVLIRAAVSDLLADTRMPSHVFLLGSPLRPALLAQRLGKNPLYLALTQDCGQLLGSLTRMSEVGPLSVPTTGIAGISGPSSKRSPFRGELNDGVVSLAEVSAAWLTDHISIPTLHTFLPASRRVGEIILGRMAHLRASSLHQETLL